MQNTIKPWYRYGWTWILIALPGSVVIASFISLYLAIHQPDSLVADDYYKDGLAINQQITAQQLAQQLRLHATAHLDTSTNTILLELRGQIQPLPAHLQLRMVHPTLTSQDHTLTLVQSAPGQYRGAWPLELRSLPNTKWQLQLRDAMSARQTWVMSTSVVLPQQNSWNFPQ